MKTPAVALTLLALVACSRGGEPTNPAPEPSPLTPAVWSARTPDGRFVVQQTPSGAGCRLAASEGDRERWSAELCAGTHEDLHYLSPDGDRLLVLYPLPEGTKGKDWSEATVARIFARGEEERRFVGAELVAPEAIADMSRDFSWVKGVGSGGGQAPRYAEGGAAVLVDVVNGATLTLGFDGSGVPGRRTARPTPAAAADPAAAGAPPVAAAGPDAPYEPDESVLFRWKDRDGELHFSPWSEIPAESRARARPVTAMLGSVSGGGAPAPAAAPGGWDPAARAALDRENARLRDLQNDRMLGRAPTPSSGPRLNGLTDAERHQQEMGRLEAERAKNAEEARLWEKQFELHRTLDGARARGYRGY